MHHFHLSQNFNKTKQKKGKEEESTKTLTKPPQIPWEGLGMTKGRGTVFLQFAVLSQLLFCITQGFNSISKLMGEGMEGRKTNS